jgi:hypothetical protein
MDGFYQNDRVLVVGATNRVDALDDALLRPGRFDRTIYMGRPSPTNRLRILQVHAKNKPIDRSNDDALLRQVRHAGRQGLRCLGLKHRAWAAHLAPLTPDPCHLSVPLRACQLHTICAAFASCHLRPRRSLIWQSASPALSWPTC